MDEIKNLLQRIYEEYTSDIGLSPDAKYIHGTPLRPVVPLDTGIGGLFILGAYPSARFAYLDGISDVPVADNLGPFESERWFDGKRVRKQPSARELKDLFLGPLYVQRDQCWITDLVKIFLFKKGHIDRYHKLNAVAPEGYTRERFFELGEKSLHWLEEELVIAKPRFLIALGGEVAGILNGITSKAAQTNLLKPGVSTYTLGKVSVPVMYCAHPGNLMRTSDKNPWPDRHKKEFLPALKLAKKEYGF